MCHSQPELIWLVMVIECAAYQQRRLDMIMCAPLWAMPLNAKVPIHSKIAGFGGVPWLFPGCPETPLRP